MAIQTQPQDDAGLRSSVGLEAQGLDPQGEIHWNLTAPVLIQSAIARGEGQLADMASVCSSATISITHEARERSRACITRTSHVL